MDPNPFHGWGCHFLILLAAHSPFGLELYYIVICFIYILAPFCSRGARDGELFGRHLLNTITLPVILSRQLCYYVITFKFNIYLQIW